MDQLKNLSDDRLVDGCIYCGGSAETRDHVPSRIFLDTPFPENLPVVGACLKCNHDFSLDEEYIACFIESVTTGSTDPEQIRRPKIAEILGKSPALRTRLEADKYVVEGKTYMKVDNNRMKNVLLKLARGHAAYELCQICREEPSHLWFGPLVSLTEDQRESFNSCQFVEMLGEIGSRQMQRLQVVQYILRTYDGKMSTINALINDWVEVQLDRYRYIAIEENSKILIKFVISEYLACEAVWKV
jgi:hypothetical protein